MTETTKPGEMQSDNKRKPWIQTLEGRKLDPRYLEPSMVGSIHEIAHSLAGEYRFTRQTDRRYSVAEHAVRGSQLLPAVFAGAFLLHECSEIYLPDIAGPLKPFLRVHLDDGETISWNELERLHTRAVLEALELSSIEPLIYSPEIKRMDWAMLAAEKRDLCGPSPEDWGLPHAPAELTIHGTWSPEAAEAAFVQRFTELFGANHPALTRPPAPTPSTDILF